MELELQPLIDFIQTFPQWFQMVMTIIVILGGGLVVLIKTMISAAKAGLFEILMPPKKKGKK